MKKLNWILPAGVFLISLAVGLILFKNKGMMGGMGNYAELEWKDLGELDYNTGESSEKLKASDNKDLRIPGFMVPLEDNQKLVTEFLLVPSPQACIHVPPPPPNQMVHITMESGREIKAMYGPIWIYGKFQLRSKRHMYGESSFSMKGVKVEPYR